MKSVKIKLIKGGGYGDVKYTPEQAKAIMEASRKSIIQGRRQREAYESLGISADDAAAAEKTGLSQGDAIVLNQIKRNEENKRKTDENMQKQLKGIKEKVSELFPQVRNREVLNQVAASIPLLARYDPKVVKKIIDNKTYDLTDRQWEEYYELTDAIIANPYLDSLFPADSNIHDVYEDELPEQQAHDLKQFNKYLGYQQDDFLDNQERIVDKETAKFLQLDDLLNTTSMPAQERADKFKQVKKIIPSFQETYNKKKGNMPNQNITNLTRQSINEIFPVDRRLIDINEARDRQNAANMIEEALNTYDNIDAIKDQAADLESLQAIDDDPQRALELAKLQAVIDQYNRDAPSIPLMRDQLQHFDDDTMAILGKRQKLTPELKLLLRKPKPKPKLIPKIKRRQKGQGLGASDPLAPFGRFKNGNPRKRPAKNTGGYVPRNKKHWIQKKTKNEHGKIVYAGGTLTYNEMIRKLLEVKNSGQGIKAIQMLSSLQDSLPVSEYRKLYMMLNS